MLDDHQKLSERWSFEEEQCVVKVDLKPMLNEELTHSVLTAAFLGVLKACDFLRVLVGFLTGWTVAICYCSV
jgi:hypothetical protein